jgi:signal peptidase I
MENTTAKNQSQKKAEEEEINVGRELLSLVLYLLAVFAVTFFILHFVGQRTEVSGSSMELTLSDGDNLIMDKLTYHFRDPERFEIVIFPVEGDTYYIKRVIGLPGETVRIDEDGNIYINGSLLEENYGIAKIEDPGRAQYTVKLGGDEYFVMGDNRNASLDSRFAEVGNIKRSRITGRAWARIYPFNEMTLLKDYEVK